MFSASFIIPCYNSENFIFFNISKLIKKISLFKINYEIIIINDGSNDQTFFELIKLKKKYKAIKIINSTRNFGKSFSQKKALNISKYKNIILIDADLPYFSYLSKVISELKKKKDLVIVDRNNKKSFIRNKKLSYYTFSRKYIGLFISKMIFFFLRINLGFIDTQAGLKGFSKIKNFKKIKFISSKFFLDLELIYLYNKLGKKITLVPVKYKLEDNSTIKFFSLNNIQIAIDFLKVILFLKFR